VRSVICFLTAVLIAAVMSLSLGADYDSQDQLPPSDALLAIDSPELAPAPCLSPIRDLPIGGYVAYRELECGHQPVAIMLTLKARHTGHRPAAGMDFGSEPLAFMLTFDPRHRSGIDNGTRAEEITEMLVGAHPRHTGQVVLGAGVTASLA